MTDGQSKNRSHSRKSSKSERLNGWTVSEEKPRNTVRVQGSASLRVLNFLYQNKGFWKAIQIKRILKMPESTVRSALRRLAGQALVAKTNKQYTVFSQRHPVIAAVLANPGKDIDIETGETVHLIQRPLERVSRASERDSPDEIIVAFRSWKEIVDWQSGWPEKKTLSTIRLPHFIIQQIRSMSNDVPKTAAGWLWFYGSEWKMRIASRQALQLYLGNHLWREEFKNWLLTVPNLSEQDLDLIWNKIAHACKHVKVTYEFHVPDEELATVRPYCFRESGSQRWRRANDHGIRIFPSSKAISRGRSIRTLGEGGKGLHQPLSTVRNCSTLRETDAGLASRRISRFSENLRKKTSGTTGGFQEGIGERDLQGERGTRTQTQAIAAATAGGGI